MGQNGLETVNITTKQITDNADVLIVKTTKAESEDETTVDIVLS